MKCLQCLNNDKLNHIQNITIGRDHNVMNDYAEEIIQYCKDNNLHYIERSAYKKTNAKYVISIGWRWIINIESHQKLIIFHDSLLPKYRGFNPLVTALINGDSEIGVTVLFGTSEFDKGDIISQYKIKVTYPIKIEKAIELVSKGYTFLFFDIIKKILDEKEIISIPQNEELATYSVWRDEYDYFIDWTKSSYEIKRFIDAVGFPYKGARTKMDNQEILVHDVEIFKELNVSNPDIGKVLLKQDQFPVIICGTGLIMITKISDLFGNYLPFPSKFRIRFK